MRSLDTNILVRFLLNDSDPQVAVAKRMLSEPSLLLPSVILETVWVLSSVSGWSRAKIANGLTAMLTLPEVTCSHAPELRWCIARYRDGADFPDMLHLALSGKADSFATFDRRIARYADPAVVPVETLA